MTADRLLLRAVDGGLIACLLGVPLLMGGKHAAGQLVLLALAIGAALAWTARQCLRRQCFWRRSPADWFVLAGLLLLMGQLAPLGTAVLSRVAPRASELLPLWMSAGPSWLGTWSCVSLTPAATQAALPLFLSYGLLLLVTIQRVQDIEDVERLVRWTALSAAGMACLGLLQWAAGNGKFFWFHEHPYSDTLHGVKGSFANRNHFAHFLALGAGPWLWWLQTALSRREAGLVEHRGTKRTTKPTWSQTPALMSCKTAPLPILALGLMLFATLMSLSRGGAVALFTAAIVSVMLGYKARTLGPRFVLGLAALALLTAASLTIYGYQQVSNRLGQLTSWETLDGRWGRVAIWTADARAVADFLPLGSGVGSHAEVHQVYLDAPLDRQYTHAENGPLQVLLEAGIPGLALMLAAVGFCGAWCIGALRVCSTAVSPAARRSRDGHDNSAPRRIFLCAAAISASLAANLVHSMVDFVWYMPGCMLVVVIFAGCAFRLWQLGREAAAGARFGTLVALPRVAAAAALLILAAGGAGMVFGRVGPAVAQVHWDRFLVLDRAAATTLPRETPTLDALTQRIEQLEEVVRWDPQHSRARLRLAETLLRRFELLQENSDCPMPLSQVSDAALTGGFTSSEQVQQWLGRVLGQRRADLDRASEHTRRALAICPLHGEGYLCLSQLGFLEGPAAAAAKPALLAQAIAVRPFDGAVLLEAGREASLAGNLEQALDYWRRSFRAGPSHRRQIIELLAERVPVGFLLETFQPDLDGLRALHEWYVKCGGAGEVPRLCGMYRALAGGEAAGGNEETAAAKQWLQGQLLELRRWYAQVAQREAEGLAGADAAAAWLEVRSLHGMMGDRAAELQSAEKAARCDPSNFQVRHALAHSLLAAGRVVDAEPHLHWCVQRRPNDASLRTLLRETVKKRIDQQGPAMSAVPGQGTRR